MSRAMITEGLLTDIADAIRSKLGVSTTYTPAEMATAIGTISGGGGGALPATYQQVEYLEFYGAQYVVDEGINLVKDDVIVAIVSLDSSVASSVEDGVIGGNASDTYEIYFYNSGLRYYGKISGTNKTGISANTKYLAHGTMSAAGADISIGRYNSDYTHKGKVWEVFVFGASPGAVLRHYVPCYRKADSVAGFYEVIRGAFYTNQGTGTIGVGPDVT